MLVDDDEASLAALAELVGREGFTTDVAGTLREGREKISARRPDIVLLDIHLPDGNGMDLFEDVESRSTTEVVLMTGQPSLQTSIEALRLGAGSLQSADRRVCGDAEGLRCDRPGRPDSSHGADHR